MLVHVLVNVSTFVVSELIVLKGGVRGVDVVL